MIAVTVAQTSGIRLFHSFYEISSLGSDEYAGYVQCPNTCKELGAAAREQAEKAAAVAREGYQKRQQLIQAGTKAKEDRKKALDEYLRQKAELEPQKAALETKKQETEKLESAAKEEHRSKWESNNISDGLLLTDVFLLILAF